MPMPKFTKFADVINWIDKYYDFVPVAFTNNGVENQTTENLGSHKIFSYAIMNGLDEQETLDLFCEFYREVLSTPGADNHANIRAFMTGGWAGFKFKGTGTSLVKKGPFLNDDLAEMIKDPARKSYLFPEIGRRKKEALANNPDLDIISLGIGDVTLPIPPVALKKLREIADELEKKNPGYPADVGMGALQDAILADYAAQGIKLEADEIFTNDGAKADTANITFLFGAGNKIAIGDPVYPVYVDSNAMSGKLGTFNPETKKYSNAIYLPMTKENGFKPELPTERPDIIYMCFPNNPTGAVLTRDETAKWVDYAIKNKSVILYDAAYEAFITEKNIPHSIYEIPGAETCAIEFRSRSKDAGFTGIRSGHTVVPKAINVNGNNLNAMWNRRQSTFYNGASYLTQWMSVAMFTPEGKEEIQKLIAYYRKNAEKILATFKSIGIEAFGGINAPYVYAKAPDGVTGNGATIDWKLFDSLLNGLGIVSTPGSGFGPSGEGYVRFTAFGSHENTDKACERIVQKFGKGGGR